MTHLPGIIHNPWDKKTHVLWSSTPENKAIIFVHGFSGNYSSWGGFPEMIVQNKKFKGYDIFIMEYSWEDRAELTGATFREFLTALFSDRKEVTDTSTPPFERDENYKQIIIAAHSLGAIVARVALLSAYKDKVDWLDKTKLMLYAPAHNGANIIQLAASTLGALGSIGEALPSIFKLRFPSLIDLETNTSKVIDRLRNETKQLLSQGKGDFTKARSVLFGGKDRIVDPSPFGEDAEIISIPGIGHSEICKPTTYFSKPFKVLEKNL